MNFFHSQFDLGMFFNFANSPTLRLLCPYKVLVSSTPEVQPLNQIYSRASVGEKQIYESPRGFQD